MIVIVCKSRAATVVRALPNPFLEPEINSGLKWRKPTAESLNSIKMLIKYQFVAS